MTRNNKGRSGRALPNNQDSLKDGPLTNWSVRYHSAMPASITEVSAVAAEQSRLAMVVRILCGICCHVMQIYAHREEGVMSVSGRG